MNELTRQLFAQIYLDKITSEDFVDWAIACLEEGLDTRSLRMLAASDKPYYSSDKPYYSIEIEERFNKALNELVWEKPTEKESLLSYAKMFAREIIEGNISPLKGSHEIFMISLELDYPPELKGWLYLNEGYDPVTMEHLWDSYNFPHADREEWNESVIREAKKLVETDFA
jgi:hypothetical protein